MKDRVKTDVRVPPELAETVAKLSHALGVPQNAIYTLGAGFLAVQLAQMGGASAKSRDKLLDSLEETLKDLLKEARKVA